ncbi:hypothetical protein BOX15_Mlig004634g1 [Macrostomum lignano]|uniref:RNA-binding protein vts1-like alpha-helical domain-containing protein n=1 Tax=Macrostomum lignano TaxID=282301 RepID=A0A267FGT8_9PLAT|nr:hypothetical protein BOX15_Mlig004634g1 [Macrostomum lignano]
MSNSHNNDTSDPTPDSVLNWFSSRLEPHERIELLSSLLLNCAPLELRFLATWSAAAADAGAGTIELREAEARVNSPAELLRLTEPEAGGSGGGAVVDAALCRLTLALALVRPDNADCGRLLADWLARLDLQRATNAAGDASGGNDGGLLRHACLVGALALRQPALPFASRLRMLPVQRALASRLALARDSNPEAVCCSDCTLRQSGAAAAASTTPTVAGHRLRSRSATAVTTAAADESAWLGTAPPLPPMITALMQHWRQRRLSDATELDVEARRPPGSRPKKQRTGTAAYPGLCLRQASLATPTHSAPVGSVGLDAPFCIHATLWPGSVRSEIVRSLSDLLALYAKVQPHLRTQQAARIPLLDGLLNRGKLASRLSAESVTSAVQMLLRLLVELPEPVRRSADIVEFFSARRPPRPPQPPTVAHSRASSDSAAAKPGLMLQFQSLTVGSVGYTGEGTAVYPACHYGQDYQSKLLTWLKTHRMHKYFDRLRKYSFEQLLAIDRPTLEALEFTQGAIKKLLGMLERVRQDRQAFDCPSRSSGSPCSSGACSEEELQMHGLLRSPPQQQHQAMLRKQQMVQQQQQQQHRMLGPLPLPLPLQPPMPPHLQHPQQLKQQQQQQQQQQRQPLRYNSGVSRASGSPA